MAPPFRFTVQCHGPADHRAWVEQARRAEALGYDTITVPDHLDDALGPASAIVAAASATSTIGLGVMVYCNDYRNPAVLAREVATLDVICGGRLTVGLGAGWKASDYAESGIPFDAPGRRIDRLAEVVPLLRALWAPGEVHHDGSAYRVHATDDRVLPVRRPHPPILIGGGGHRVLSLAGQEADIVGLNIDLRGGRIDERAGPTATADATDEKVRWIQAAAADRTTPPVLHTRIHLAMVTDDRDAVAEAVAPAFGLTPEAAKHSPHALVGSVEEIVDQCHVWRDRWGISAIGLSADVLEPMAPVVARLAGT